MILKHTRQWAHTKSIKFSPLLSVLPSESFSANLHVCSCIFGYRHLSVFSHLRPELWKAHGGGGEGKLVLNVVAGPV